MKHIIINVGRQLGSGGHDIGRMLALDFQAKYYDRELLNLAAKESGLSEKIFEQNDEKKGFFRGLLNLGSPHVNSDGGYKSRFSQETLFQFQSDAIVKAAKEGSCVFVGRCADYVLRDFGNTVNVFITASLPHRVERIMTKQHLTEEEALKVIKGIDKARETYIQRFAGVSRYDVRNYHLALCADGHTEEQLAQQILSYIG